MFIKVIAIDAVWDKSSIDNIPYLEDKMYDHMLIESAHIIAVRRYKKDYTIIWTTNDVHIIAESFDDVCRKLGYY